MVEIETPECDKLAEVHHERVTLAEFLEWLSGQGLWVAEEATLRGYMVPTGRNLDSLVLQFLGIDEAKLEAERRALLDALRQETR